MKQYKKGEVINFEIFGKKFRTTIKKNMNELEFKAWVASHVKLEVKQDRSNFNFLFKRSKF